MEVWIQLAALIFTILSVSGGGLWAIFRRLEENRLSYFKMIAEGKEDTDSAVEAGRTALALEAKELRSEMAKMMASAYLELGEAPKALREKLNQVEIWMRDNLLPRREYERDQDKVLDEIKNLHALINNRFEHLEEKLDGRS